MIKRKNLYRLLLLICCGLFTLHAMAQKSLPKPITDSIFNTRHLCSTDAILQKLRKDKDFKAREDRMNDQIARFARPAANDTLIIPVVIHIVNSDPLSIEDSTISNGIKDLNDAFSKSGSYSASLGADTKIRFCIAKKDPDGGNTTGITRTTAYFGNDLNMDNEDDKLKNLIQWDPSRYLNIWLIRNINTEGYANYNCGKWVRIGVGGYATLPPNNGPLDGIVITGFGILLAHETGHYLGLYHTFEGFCNNFDCANNGDRVCDTPPDGSMFASPGCGSPTNSCGTDTLSAYSNGFFTADVPDQIDNFMDYSNPACSNRFTQGQADRMRAAILTQRPGLLANQCNPPCAELITAAYTRDTAFTAAGDSVNFTNTTTGASNFSWLINNVAASSSINFQHIFPTVGKFKITLKAFNADSNCFSSYTTYVLVNCGVAAKFYINKRAIASRIPLYPDSIVFVNTSFRGVSYQWLLANDKGMAEHVETTTTNFTYIFPVPGNYTIRLIATNGSCSDTSGIQNIAVTDPDADAAIYMFNTYCFQQTKIKVSFCISNFGYTPLPKNTPVTFYDADPRLPGAVKLSPTFYLPFETQGLCTYCFYDQTLDVPYARLNQVYAVVNDSGTTTPLLLPNTSLPEKNYFNNIALISNIKFRVVATPATATLLPGDTLQLQAQAFPAGFPSATYKWNDAYKLSCTACVNPQLYADSDRIKRIIAISQFGCVDTTFINIKVPPANDYTVNINSICPVKDSMTINFTLFNQFFRGVIPKNLVVAFYNGDPRVSGAILLPPLFSIADTSFTLQKTFNTRIKIMQAGSLYAVVNDSAITIPINLPNTPKLEKIYTNNTNNIPFAPNKTLYNIDICKGQLYFGYNTAGTYTDTLANYKGCDSIRTVRLTVKPVFITSVTTAICFGENYAGHTTTSTYIDVYKAINGCDSTRTLFLTVKPLSFSNINAIICQGENYAGHTGTGIYTDVYAAANGCDSTRRLTLTVNPTKALRVDTFICKGESYFAGGRLQTKAGTYFDTARTYLNCDSIKTTNLLVHPLPKPNLGADRGICKDDTYTLNPGNFVVYQWQDGSTKATYSTNMLGQYFVAVKTMFGCTYSDTIVLNSVLPLPKNYLPSDSFLCLGNILRVNVPGYKTYLWSTGNTNSFTDFTTTGNYRLQVTDGFDCKGSDIMKVVFYTDCIIISIPSAFSPNSDGKNDTFKPLIPAPVTNYRMQIFNRPGQLLFETENPGKGWDGTYKGIAQDPAAFVYYITLKNYKGEIEKHKGTMVLVK